jgi:salicylate hydroxylase
MGDAAHQMYPTLAQGAAVAVEDAMVLGTLLGRLANSASDLEGAVKDIPTVLKLAEQIQRPRSRLIAEQALLNSFYNHLEPGRDEQRQRDADFAAYDPERTNSPCPWVDAGFNRWLLGRDAGRVATGAFAELVRQGRLKSMSSGVDAYAAGNGAHTE